ncbi:hypothetical protein LOZ36_002250 [Ophidiomyces ophidiicola]|nr:hypothetical protein LOZ36_002250 [Ophidiomyces ophidiicola]
MDGRAAPPLHSPQAATELEAATATISNDHEFSALHRELETELHHGETATRHDPSREPKRRKIQSDLDGESAPLKAGEEWDRIMADAGSAVSVADGIATARALTEAETENIDIVIDPEISAGTLPNDSMPIISAAASAQGNHGQPSASDNPSGSPQAQGFDLLERSESLHTPSLVRGLPAPTEFAHSPNHLNHPTSPFSTPNITQHAFAPGIPSEQQRISESLLPDFAESIQTTPAGADQQPRNSNHFDGMRLIPDPPNLQQWRERLFNVEDTIVLSEEEFQTYFPHVDNVYSHRSTQRYKRKPFISHYWDCRLKGRPPGTPKSVDPNKKKRKRTARERNLCDVKIKITEYFPGAMTNPPEIDMGITALAGAVEALSGDSSANSGQPFGVLAPSTILPDGHPGATGARYYTIQRVNGNGGNGRSDAAGGPHRHTLEESDRIKKNSVQRSLVKDEKEKKKAMVAQVKTYHKKASGYAWLTVNKHKRESDLKLYGSCFCPFVQRVWIALEVKGIPYQYIEVDPYKKPQSLLDVNPRGLVPAIRHGDWGCHESTVLLEYVEELDTRISLLPPQQPQLRAHCRLWADHVGVSLLFFRQPLTLQQINRNLIPCFYRLLQEQELEKQIRYTEELKDHIAKLVDASHATGPFFLGQSISFVDIQFAPWMLRLSRVLKPYRGWPDPEKGSRWAKWVDAMEADDQVMATTSSDELYLDNYQRYAENRPDTSMLATAINTGRPLP